MHSNSLQGLIKNKNVINALIVSGGEKMTAYTSNQNKVSHMKFQKTLTATKRGLLLSVAMGSVLALSACSNDNDNAASTGSAEEVNQTSQQNTMDVKQPEPVEQTKQNLVEKVELPKSESKTQAAPEKTEAVAEKSVEATPAVPEISPKAAMVETQVKETAAEKIDVVEEKVEKKVEEKVEEVTASVNGQQVYATCAGCHGAQAEGGIGPKLAGQEVADIVDKLKRYKAGEQVGPLTGMMAPMATPLSDAEMQAVAEYTSSL